MHKQINRFTDFMSWLLKQYREILEYTSRNYPFRIVEARRSPRTGETLFTIQFVGKSTCIKLGADELAEDDDLIQGFAPRDVKQIIKASLIKNKLKVIQGGLPSAPLKIIAKNFEREHNRPSYVIEQQTTGNKTSTKTVSLEDVTKSKETLLKFSKQDIYEIAYSAGINSILTAQEDIERNNKD